MTNAVEHMQSEVMEQQSRDAGSVRQVPVIVQVREIVTSFVASLPEVREVKVDKLTLVDAQAGSWEADVECYVPNATIRSLGLPVSRQVMDRQVYTVKLDGRLNIVAYGLRESIQEGRE